jgi:hypothetical protein
VTEPVGEIAEVGVNGIDCGIAWTRRTGSTSLVRHAAAGTR